MSLSGGTRLGPYEILSPLGAGGMGEVYRARDTKLDRGVAIKILPERLATDEDALERFEREAKAVAALNHPNILGIYDFGKEGSVSYAAMELLEGETLREKLGSPVPVRKAIEYAVQVAQGLAAAHEKGIVHRDLKPENLFVTNDGRVKILDFGLAKVVAAEIPGTNAPTAALGTEPGVVMGTVGYMSPEQVRARPADHRSDIFSFGAILYEMLSGKRAFRGDSAAETMAAIANTDPPELSTTSANVSPTLDGIVRHCLEKSPSERFQSARDLAFDLQASSTSSARSGTTARFAGRGVRIPTLAAAVAAVAVVLALSAAFRVGSAVGERRARSHPPSFQRLTFRRGTVLDARFSSDGKTLVYCAAWQGEPPSLYSARATAPQSQKLDLPPATLFSISRSDEVLDRPRLALHDRLHVRSDARAGGDLGGSAETDCRARRFGGLEPGWPDDGDLPVRGREQRSRVSDRARPLFDGQLDRQRSSFGRRKSGGFRRPRRPGRQRGRRGRDRPAGQDKEDHPGGEEHRQSRVVARRTRDLVERRPNGQRQRGRSRRSLRPRARGFWERSEQCRVGHFRDRGSAHDSVQRPARVESGDAGVARRARPVVARLVLPDRSLGGRPPGPHLRAGRRDEGGLHSLSSPDRWIVRHRGRPRSRLDDLARWQVRRIGAPRGRRVPDGLSNRHRSAEGDRVSRPQADLGLLVSRRPPPPRERGFDRSVRPASTRKTFKAEPSVR